MTYLDSTISVLEPQPVDDVAVLAASDTCKSRRSRDTTKSAKIMIVDDEPINIKVVRKYLQGSGYTSFVSTTEALQRLRDGVR